MFSRFYDGKCSLSETFWRYSVLGLTVLGFVSRFLMINLKQHVNYDVNFFRMLWRNLSVIRDSSANFVWLFLYVVSFLAVVVYSLMCVTAMWRVYKDYEKSKILAFICMALVWAMVYFAVRTSMY
jgi:hypothetical protein